MPDATLKGVVYDVADGRVWRIVYLTDEVDSVFEDKRWVRQWHDPTHCDRAACSTCSHPDRAVVGVVVRPCLEHDRCPCFGVPALSSGVRWRLITVPKDVSVDFTTRVWFDETGTYHLESTSYESSAIR